MVVTFQNLPNDARVWIFPSNRPFSELEISELNEAFSKFLQDWTAHGADLLAGFSLPYNRFIVIGLDQTAQNATGCAIDKLVHFVQQIETKFDVVLLDKMNVTYKQGAFLAHKSLSDFKKMAQQHAVSKDTIVFNNLVDTKHDFDQFWEVPAKESWHQRFFK